ncbi:MAG: hypothetical protein NZZ41_05530 [Candidatus Dojkabacteria bacterium]|nr:hypothetical protein [Candidatus Dojkabacteria bacterium]
MQDIFKKKIPDDSQEQKAHQRTVFLIKRVNMFGESEILETCETKQEAEKLVDFYNKNLPKGELFWFFFERKTL